MKKKKSTRKPVPPRSLDDPIVAAAITTTATTTAMVDDNTTSNSQHVHDEENDQNPHSIQQIKVENPNPNPSPNPMSIEEDKEVDDVLEQHELQPDEAAGAGELETIDEVEDGEEEKQIEVGAPGTHKRKKHGKQGPRLEKKLKQEAVAEEMKIEDEVNASERQQKESQDDQPTAPSVSRRTSKKNKKKKKMNARQKAAFDKKLKQVQTIMNPIPFVPRKALDFSQHQQLFKLLGLWEFVNMEFDQDIRSDLIAMLVTNYNPTSHFSTVNGVRIKLSRAELARALKLPVKKDKSISLEIADFDSDTVSEESVSFMGEFLSNWILLHEDTWILTDEVLNWDDLIKKGQPHKVDWAGFLWYMVEKELKQLPEIGTLYFASHIQCLIKSQRVDLFEEKPLPEVPVEMEPDLNLKMGSSKDYEESEFEKQQTELCLGQNESKEQYDLEDTMVYEESKQEPGGQEQWFLDGKNNLNSHCLQRCGTSKVQNQQSQHDGIEEVQHGIEEVEDEEYDPQQKCSTMGGLASADIFQGIGTTSITYSPSFRNPGPSSGGLFQSGIDAHFNLGGMSMHVNSFKREVGHSDADYHDAFSDHHNQKQMRSDLLPPDFNYCMKQIHYFTNKAKEMYEEKEKSSLNANMHEELLSDLQHQNHTLMDYLQKNRGELQRREMENYKLERELHLMSDLLVGYRNALKETRREFSEYRKRNPEPEEPLYMDAGPGGLVLSATELEKLCLKREENEKINRGMIRQVVVGFVADCEEKFEGYKDRIHQLDNKLLELEEIVKVLHLNKKSLRHNE